MRVDGTSPRSRSAHIRRRSAETTEATTEEPSSTEFGGFMNKALTRNGESATNEEAIFSALVHHGISSRGDGTALSKLEERMEKHARILERKVGYASDEKSAKFALRDLVRNKLITKDEATQLYSRAFAAAQLDSDTEALSDGVGGNSAESTGVISQVVSSLEAKMASYTASASSLALRSLGEGTTKSALDVGSSFADLVSNAVFGSGDSASATPLDGPNMGFLYKPVSDTQGKLVILAPESMTGKVGGVVLKDSSGQVIERGSSGGVGNGGREHFRFSKPGGSYPENLTVEIQVVGGGAKTYSIPDPSKRYD